MAPPQQVPRAFFKSGILSSSLALRSSGDTLAPAASTLLWQVWSQPVQGKNVAKLLGFEVSSVLGSRSLQLSGMSWQDAPATIRATTARAKHLSLVIIVPSRLSLSL